MRPTMLPDARAVIMCGISGSGKTVFAKRLEAEGYRRISVDEAIWHDYGGSFNELPPQCLHTAYAEVNKKIIAAAAEALGRGESIVLDAAMCKRAVRDAAVDACRRAGAEPVIVYLPATYDTLARRLEGRRGLGPDDQIVTVEQLRGFYANFEPPTDDENFIIPGQC